VAGFFFLLFLPTGLAVKEAGQLPFFFRVSERNIPLFFPPPSGFMDGPFLLPLQPASAVPPFPELGQKNVFLSLP